MEKKKKLKILVVDDTDNLRDAIIFLLQLLDHEAIGAESAEQAEELIREDHFDLIFSDIKMGGKDGIELAEHLKTTHPDMPVVLMTAYDDFSDFLKRAREAKVFAVYTKPLTEKKILEVIDKVIKK